jgi:hypothetical protein
MLSPEDIDVETVVESEGTIMENTITGKPYELLNESTGHFSKLSGDCICLNKRAISFNKAMKLADHDQHLLR